MKPWEKIEKNPISINGVSYVINFKIAEDIYKTC